MSNLRRSESWTGAVELSVYDIQGQRVKRLVQEVLNVCAMTRELLRAWSDLVGVDIVKRAAEQVR